MKKAIILENLLICLLTAAIVWIITAFFYQNSLANTKMVELRDILTTLSNTETENVDYEISLMSKSSTVKFQKIERGEKSTESEVEAARNVGYAEKSSFYGIMISETISAAQQLNDGTVIRVYSDINGIRFTWLSILVAFLMALVIAFKFANKFVENIKFLLHGANLTLERAGNVGGITVSPEPETLQYEELVDCAHELCTTATSVSNRMKELYIENKRIEYLLNNMHEGLVVLHKDMSIVMLNSSAERFFDVTESVKGQNVLHLTHTPAICDALDEAVKSGKPKAIDMEIPGKKLVLQILISAVYNEEKDINGAIMLISDVTEVRLAEQIRSEFVANASHELKTPLTSIKGFSELIDSGVVSDPEKVHGYLEQIKGETERMIGVINDILELSEIEATVKDTGMVQLSIKLLAQKVCNSLENQIKDKNIKISVSGDLGNIEANSNHMQQILLNLIDNAIKYNVDGGSVDVTIKQTVDKVMLKVSDTGVGIPKDSQNRVFERFYRVDKSRSRKAGGTGLGLSIVKHIVELYSGKIELESELEKGTAITVTFPA